MATKNTILGTVPKSRGRYTEGDTTTKWYYDNILEYKGSSFRCISKASTGITGAPATYNSSTHTLVPNTGWEFFVDTTGALDVGERFTENENKLSELESEVNTKTDSGILFNRSIPASEMIWLPINANSGKYLRLHSVSGNYSVYFYASDKETNLGSATIPIVGDATYSIIPDNAA